MKPHLLEAIALMGMLLCVAGCGLISAEWLYSKIALPISGWVVLAAGVIVLVLSLVAQIKLKKF